MATTISTQDIVDAKRDIDDIGKAVNESVIVTPRYGAPFKSLPMSMGELQAAIEAAATAGAGANGWTDLLIQTEDGSTQRAKNSSFQSQIDEKPSQQYVDEKLDLKAPKETTYTKTEVDSVLSLKAPQETTYTKAEVDTTFAAYVGGRKAYTTLALAQTAQSSLPANTAIEVTNDPNPANNGTYQWNGTTLTKSVYDPLTQSKQFTLNEIFKYLEAINPRSGWILPVLDAIKQVIGGFDTEGEFWVGNTAIQKTLLETAWRVTDTENLIFSTADPNRTGVIFSIRDDANQLLVHLATDFVLYIAGTPIGLSPELVEQINDVVSSVAAINNTLNPLNTFVAYGDSTIEGAGSTDGKTFTYYLSQLTGKSVSNQGIGGQVSQQISARANGTALLVTFPNNVIPATTTPVEVTLNINLLYTPATTSARTRNVIVNGVAGVLTKDTANKNWFARSAAGDAVNVAPNSLMKIVYTDLQDRIAIFGMGTNDSFETEADRLKVIEHIDNAIAALSPVNKKFIVVSPWKTRNSNSLVGSATHTAMLEMHKMLAAKYKDRFVNAWFDLVCAYNPENADDVDAYNNMVTPPSLMPDGVHPNNAGYYIMALAVFIRLTQLGWI